PEDDRPCKPRCDDRPPKHDSRRPFVVDESPRDGAFRVSTFTDVLVTFSESVRGVDHRSFRLFNARTGRSVFADVFRSGSSRRWVLVPDRRLSRGSRYVAVVKGGFSGIRDFAGNRLSTTTWTFRTGR
ncbi:MAG TPA: Ig-like domain-containing protein, partial [Nocardioidaceae bacterium]|nr:Ig-like domain-containing protein [Nocardioidaceae bacterium]